MENPNYYAVITADVRYDKRLKASEKLLYGELSALSNKHGYCNASNSYFANLYEKHKDTISDWINNLKKYGYITVELIKDKNEVVERRIYMAKMPIPIGENTYTPIGENTEENNTSIEYKEEEKEINKEKDGRESNSEIEIIEIDKELGDVINFYNNNITLISETTAQEIGTYMDDGLTGELIKRCIKEAVDQNARKWKYIKAILDDCKRENIKTKEEYEIKQKEFREKQKKKQDKQSFKEKSKQEVSYNTDFSEYDQYVKRDDASG